MFRRSDGTAVAEGTFVRGLPNDEWRYWNEVGSLVDVREHFNPWVMLLNEPDG
jgi:hypothetical protein